MTANHMVKSLALGFLRIFAHGDALQGGYLLTSDFGRPLEFHYTAPLVFGRTERALYGASFEPVVWIEWMARPLTDKQSTAPRVLFVTQEPLLELRRHIPAPVVALARADSETEPRAKVHPDFPQDRAAYDKALSLICRGFDLLEPFRRMEAALAELDSAGPRAA